MNNELERIHNTSLFLKTYPNAYKKVVRFYSHHPSFINDNDASSTNANPILQK